MAKRKAAAPVAPIDDRPHLSLQELCRREGWSLSTGTRRLKSGLLPKFVRLPGSTIARFPVTWVERWELEHSHQRPDEVPVAWRRKRSTRRGVTA